MKFKNPFSGKSAQIPAKETSPAPLQDSPDSPDSPEIETEENTQASNPVEDALNHPELFQAGELADILNFAPSEESPADFSLLSGETPENLDEREEDEAALSFDDLTVESVEEKKSPLVVRRRIVKQERGGAVKRITFGIVYTLSVICIGVMLALTMISVGNDIFAFVKDDSLYEVTIEDSKMSLKDLSKHLEEEGIIQYPLVFRLYVGLKNDGELTLKEGTFILSPSYNYDKILLSLNPTPPQEEVTITIAEGMTIDDMIDIFVEKGIGTREGFVDAIENGEFDYWFLEDLQPNEERFYRLEGYLYPDTYRFYTNSSETAVLKKMLNNFNRKVPKSYKEECEKMGLTMDQAVTLASLIEAECLWIADFDLVSGVFYNRLKDSSFNGRFDSDATIQYYLRHTTGSRKEDLTEEDLKIDSPYNSRLYGGYPPGPICNPSLNALTAAIYPNTKDGYKYFVAQSNGYNLYAKTYSQHLKNIETVKNEKNN